MFANIPRIAVALLVVAFVPARVPANVILGRSYDSVSDLYSATDHKFVGSFGFRPWKGLLSPVIVRIDQPFNFGLKYRHVYVDLYRFEDVMPGCVTVGDVLVDVEGEKMNIYDESPQRLNNNVAFKSELLATLIPGNEDCIIGRVVVMYAQNQENDEYSPIACGRIRPVDYPDYFMEELNSKLTLPPVPVNTEKKAVPLSTEVKSTSTPVRTESNVISAPVPEGVKPAWPSVIPLPIDFEPNSSKVPTKDETGAPSVPTSVEAASPSVSSHLEATPLPIQTGSESPSMIVSGDSTTKQRPIAEDAEASGSSVFTNAKTTSRPQIINLASNSSSVPTNSETGSPSVPTSVEAASPSVSSHDEAAPLPIQTGSESPSMTVSGDSTTNQRPIAEDAEASGSSVFPNAETTSRPQLINLASNSSSVPTNSETGSPSVPTSVEAASPSVSSHDEAAPLPIQTGSESPSMTVSGDSTTNQRPIAKDAEASGSSVFTNAKSTSRPLLRDLASNSSIVPTGVKVSTGVKAKLPSVLTDAEPTSPPSYQYVSDLFSAIDHRFVGSFNYSLWEAPSNVVKVQVGNSLHFASKYPYVAIMLYRSEDVLPGCRTFGPALVDQHDQPLVIYSGKDTGIIDNSDYSKILLTSLVPERKYPIANSVVVMYSANAQDPKPSPVACGKIGDNTSADDFLGDHSNEVSEPKPTDLPSPSNRAASINMLRQFEAVTDLYSAETGRFAGSVIYQTWNDDSLQVAVLSLNDVSNEGSAVAVVYRSKDVLPGCVTTGPAVARDELNGTRPVTLFMDRFGLFAEPFYGNVVDYTSVSPRSNFDIMGRVVVVYAFESESPIVLDDFLQPTNPHTPFACGAIRSADASEDKFLQWAPAGVKPIVISEARKWMSIASSIVQSYA